jgi:uncharacterized protein DUF3224
MHAEGDFVLRSFDEKPIEEFDNGTKVTRARIVTAYTGDLTGTATADVVMYYSADGTARILGFQRFEGTIGEREGAFVMESLGEFDGELATASLTVMAGHGTGDLAGIDGSGTTAAPMGPNGTYTLNYDG